MPLPHLARHEHGVDRKLRGCKPEGFTGERLVHAIHFVQHFTRLNLGDPVLRIALAVTHTDFGRLLGDRLVREDADPDAAATLDVAGHRPTGRFDLTCGQTAAASRLEAVLAEAYLRTAGRQAGIAALLLLTIL